MVWLRRSRCRWPRVGCISLLHFFLYLNMQIICWLFLSFFYVFVVGFVVSLLPASTSISHQFLLTSLFQHFFTLALRHKFSVVICLFVFFLAVCCFGCFHCASFAQITCILAALTRLANLVIIMNFKNYKRRKFLTLQKLTLAWAGLDCENWDFEYSLNFLRRTKLE